MSRRAPIHVRPTWADVAVARAFARVATPREENTLRALTLIADEKVVIGLTSLFWAHARFGQEDRRIAREADRLLCNAVLATALPHLLKHLFARERPNRTIARGRRRHGIPRSGKAWDSFPSGHALLIGAVAGPLIGAAPTRLRPAIWPALAMLAASRIMLLAHYPSDVAAGLGLGVAIDRITGWLFRRAR